MLELVKKSERKTRIDYYREFSFRLEHGRGCSFPCDKNGKLHDDMCQSAKQNYENCMNGTYDVIDNGIVPYTTSWIEHAQGKCECGHIITLATFTNTCEKCGRDYSISGQSLAPRSQWGEETGESLQDILDIGHTIS